MQASEQIPIDFDEWVRLARDNPRAFEQKRLALIATAIDAAPPNRQHRLQGLQWRIDQTRRQARSPIGACLAISRMMLDCVYGNNGLVDTLSNLKTGQPQPRARARLLPFRQRKRSN